MMGIITKQSLEVSKKEIFLLYYSICTHQRKPMPQVQNTEKFSLKDELFNAEKVEQIALEIGAVYEDFSTEDFVAETLSLFPELELKECINHIRDMFKKYLVDDYRQAVTTLLKALPQELDPSKSDDDFGEFIYAPYAEYVTMYGCTEEHLDFSLLALREITKRFSVEFAIRDFINAFPKETLAMLEECSTSMNYHERRLASEGLRPKLPWAKKLNIKHTEPLQHLDKLFYDKTRYVTRSVANHLNDIAKIDAALVVGTLKKWKESQKQNSKEMEFILSHALRTLVKQGDADALALLGYAQAPSIKVSNFKLEGTDVLIGEALVFDFELEAEEESKLMVDYIIHFRTKAGSSNPKVHKLKKLNLQKDENMSLTKKHLFKANMSTRTLYEGEHKVELQINGTIYESEVFTLSKGK